MIDNNIIIINNNNNNNNNNKNNKNKKKKLGLVKGGVAKMATMYAYLSISIFSLFFC